MRFIQWGIVTLLFFHLSACSTEEPSGHSFTESAVLIGMADNHIVNVIINTELSHASDKLVTSLEIEAVTTTGEGATFEAQSTMAQLNNQQLVFTWTDAFTNQGHGTLSPISNKRGAYRLILAADKLAEPRIARYMHEYLVHQRRGNSSNANIDGKTTNTPDSQTSGNQG